MNNNLQITRIISIIFLISLVSYTIAYTRRILVPKYDERMIIILESTMIFVFTLIILFFINSTKLGKSIFKIKRSFFQCFRDLKVEDIKYLLLGSLAGSLIAILWICIIKYNELSNMLLTKQSIDIIFALFGSYLLLSEQITLKKVTAFFMLLSSIYLFFY